MARFKRREMPGGYALIEHGARTDEPHHEPRFEAYREDEPTERSPRYTRRHKAIMWAMLHRAEHGGTAGPTST